MSAQHKRPGASARRQRQKDALSRLKYQLSAAESRAQSLAPRTSRQTRDEAAEDIATIAAHVEKLNVIVNGASA